MMRTKDAILQELAIEQARFAELERAREEARTKIELLRSELTAPQNTTSQSLPLLCDKSSGAWLLALTCFGLLCTVRAFSPVCVLRATYG